MLVLNRMFATLMLVAVAVYSAACNASPVVAQIPTIVVKGADHSFDIPAEIPAGLVSFTFENVGTEVHHMQLIQLNEGVTAEDAMAAFAQSEAAILPLLKRIPGGVGPLPGGGSGRMTIKLSAGNYLLICVLPDANGVPHLAHGMVAPFSVTGEAPSNQPEPASVATVKLLDFSFVLPQAVKSGQQTWKIVNEGSQPHEISIVKLLAGKTMKDVSDFIHSGQGEQPYTESGGFQGIAPGDNGWLHLDLEPGEYAALCYIPDPASGKPHTHLGMMLPFTVEEYTID